MGFGLETAVIGNRHHDKFGSITLVKFIDHFCNSIIIDINLKMRLKKAFKFMNAFNF